MDISIIELLKNNNIELQEGLSPEELEKIHSIYQIRFPDALRALLTETLPTGHGFYNWRDFSEDNVSLIKSKMNQPIEDVMTLADEIYWNEQWGEKPNDPSNILNTVKQRINDAAKLIPIYAHRYIPMIDEQNPPILSIHGVDVIYYGENLEDYFEREFGHVKKSNVKSSVYIPFWSEIL